MELSWDVKASWPITSDRFVFLMPALQEVGRALHPDDWTGRECRMGFGDMPKGGLFALLPDDYDWFAAMRRRGDAVEWIKDQALNHGLATFVRPVGYSGTPVEVPADIVWACDPPLWRVFESCRVFATVETHLVDCFVFLGRESLSRALALLAPECEPRETTESKAAAIAECRDWLIEAFADPERKATRRAGFQRDALERYEGRLSGRGFRAAWEQAVKVAPERSRAGKPKSGQ